MKIETIKRIIGFFVLLAYVGFILISFVIIYGTYQFVIYDIFSVALLQGFVLFYVYLFGSLVLMMWIIKNQDLMVRKVTERQLQKRTRQK